MPLLAYYGKTWIAMTVVSYLQWQAAVKKDFLWNKHAQECMCIYIFFSSKEDPPPPPPPPPPRGFYIYGDVGKGLYYRSIIKKNSFIFYWFDYLN